MKVNKPIIATLVILLIAAAGTGLYLGKHRSTKGAQEAAQGQQGKALYTCPMHPFIIKDKPGSCPICGMTLVKKIEQPTAASGKEMNTLGMVSLSPTQMVMANVATVEAKSSSLNKEINAVGIVQYDQTRQAKVTAWVAGRLDRLYVDSVGAYVSKGRPVAEIYSPDLVAAQQEYLLALKSREQFKNSSIQAIAQGGQGLVASARQRLKLLGVTDRQIASLEKAGEPNIRLNIYTPLSGVVVEKLVLQGQYVNMGDPLFNIADLSRVWVEVEVYENEFPNIKLGQTVDIVSQSYPGKTFRGRVAFVYPFLDPKTRTVKVRVEIPNPGLKLKPDMYVNASIKVPLGSSVVVPSSAVIDTGQRQVVWVQSKPGMFEPRDVKIGARSGDNVQIISGLNAGEAVASTGAYLLDSESQLKGGGPQNMPGMKMDQPAGAPSAGPSAAPAQPGHKGPAPAAPPSKKGGSLDMSDMKM
ncbi:efflux RND transporter periplasmic adaptor subunit [Geomesophilobacter sediminis]|uniref:Efflux RND transporter periplasmic adaptor subunit n=1 Tax=Geomesophilobacter sediminis TaxID=2798584 RepID=A0A8J7SB69_9BACT|nr:efflux RND transporter periplasmic adaptor subunit [Geomesophilobacter sediminis]MBJ6727641.1 efflux RND transporter periplasmic adaptor subunit [Geomesophilobacter sediminis]